MNSRRLMPNMGLPPTGATADHTTMRDRRVQAV
jgi:hypothetical protein